MNTTTNKTPRKNMANLMVRESITEALLRLMKKKDFVNITISELTKLAGVGRVSFYRNYETKEDVLKQYMAQISSEWWSKNHSENPTTLWKMTFEIFELLKPTVLLLRNAHLDSLLYDFIKEGTKLEDAPTTKEGYQRAMFAGIAFGLYNHWLDNGMKETSEELTAMFQAISLPYVPYPKTNKKTTN